MFFLRPPDVRPLSPVVIMSRGHSGTRVLSFLCAHLGADMGTSDDLATGDVEDLAFSAAIKKLAQSNLATERVADVTSRSRRTFARAVNGYFTRRGRPTGRWGWKFPETYLIGPCVLATLPNVRMIHMVRDGRDVAFKQHLTDDPERRLGRALLTHIGAMGRPRHEQAALSWQHQVEMFEHFKADLPKGQLHELTFENLCVHPEQELERLAAFLGTPVTAAAAQFARDEIRSDKVAQHRQVAAEDVATVTRLAHTALSRWGYVPSDAAGSAARAATRA